MDDGCVNHLVYAVIWNSNDVLHQHRQNYKTIRLREDTEVMGGLFREGQWITAKEWEHDKDNSFKRQVSSFRDTVTDSTDAKFQPEDGRYHLYVSYACPWAHRTLIVRELMGLEESISISVVHPYMGDDGWSFDTSDSEVIPDPIIEAEFLRSIYVEAKSDYTGRVTVPVLWDRKEHTIVNNESREIIRMMSKGFDRIARRERNLCPEHLEEQIDKAIDEIYEPINNGVYKCGFAGSQEAYNTAFKTLFDALDHWEDVLGKQRYVCGDTLTEADVCLFTTLLRFDPVYYVHFKCNKKAISDYKNLSGFLRELYQMPEIKKVCNMDHIKRHYYGSHPQLNPKGIVPLGPELHLDAPHGRDS